MLSLSLLIVLLLAFFGALAYLLTVYNGLLAAQTALDAIWADIDFLFRQRHEEINRLLQVCAALTQTQRETFARLAELRGRAQAAPGVTAKAALEDELTAMLRAVLSLAETSPELKPRNVYEQVRDRLVEQTERIVARRQAYNEAVRQFNLRLQTQPDAFVAGFMSMAPREPFSSAGTELASARKPSA